VNDGIWYDCAGPVKRPWFKHERITRLPVGDCYVLAIGLDSTSQEWDVETVYGVSTIGEEAKANCLTERCQGLRLYA
jgi:hypothetical protein